MEPKLGNCPLKSTLQLKFPLQSTPFLVYLAPHQAYLAVFFTWLLAISLSSNQILNNWRSETALCNPSETSKALGAQEFQCVYWLSKCLVITFWVYLPNKLWDLRKEQRSQLEERGFPGWWVERCYPSAEVFSTVDRRLFKAFHSPWLLEWWECGRHYYLTWLVSRDTNSP